MEPVSTGKPRASQAIAKQKHSAKVEEFLEVMKPRTKKGPTWANEEQPKDIQPQEQSVDATPMNLTALSDSEWLKQRMSQNVDNVGKVFEQPEEGENPDCKSSPPVSAVVHPLGRSIEA